MFIFFVIGMSILKTVSLAKLSEIKVLLSDLEFLNGDWVAYSKSKGIDFIMRAKDNVTTYRQNKVIQSGVFQSSNRQGFTFEETLCGWL